MGLKRGWQLKCNVVNMYVLNKDDNIVSLATPIGVGALAVVRISGRSLSKLFYLFTKKNPKNRLATYTNIYHPSTDVLLDKSIITYFQAPESFTGEDVIEISCHGGPFVSKTIISAAIDLGARQSSPGEFCYRAFLNGKIDLIKAEAVSSLITSTFSVMVKSLCHTVCVPIFCKTGPILLPRALKTGHSLPCSQRTRLGSHRDPSRRHFAVSGGPD